MNQTGGKKRKSDADHKIGGRRSKKKGQQIVNSGKLNFLPLDICEEIFKNLRPPDLLRLSWTSKDIRSFLMSRELSISIWRYSFSRWTPVQGLGAPPPCPSGLSHPKYAALLTTNFCHDCMKRVVQGHVTILYSKIGLMLCNACAHKHFTFIVPDCPEELLSVIPYTHRNKISGRYYHTKSIAPLKLGYEQATDKSQWIKSKQQELDVIKQEDFECKMWFMNILNALKVLIDKRKRSKLIYENEQTIIDYIRVMGWENEFKRVLATNPDGSPLKLDRVMRASGANKRITGAVLKRLEPILHQSMSEAKKERLRSEHMSSVGDQLQ